MKNPRFLFMMMAPLLVATAACQTAKSSNPLSPTVAGPIPGVEISAPRPLEPNGAKVAIGEQPLTLLLENAGSSGPRPLNYLFEVATDADFTSKVFVREGIAPGEGGRTSLRLPDPLEAGRTYYWRGRAQDGANVGPFSPRAEFDVLLPIVIDQPTPLAPINNVSVDTGRPTFTIGNAPRSGPAGPISYTIEVSDTESFGNRLAVWTGDEQPGETRLESPQDGVYGRQYFWRVRASDPTTVGPWSITQVFRLPAQPPPGHGQPPQAAGSANHVGPGPLSADRARQVVFATGTEFPSLLRVFGNEDEAVNAAGELLVRTIWHLKLAGFQAGRQRNPSNAISMDKLTIHIDGSWRAYDIYILGVAGRASIVHFMEVTPPSHLPDSGLAD